MDDLWFEDELEPLLDAIEAQVRASGDKRPTIQEVGDAARAVVRADTPLWKSLGKAELTSGKPAILWKVRLRFQFKPEFENSHFVSVDCKAHLESINGREPMPIVYDLYPRKLYKGEPQVVSLEFSPSIKVANVGISLGKISTDMDVGEIEPVVIGYPGENERKPYWELRPKRYPLKGVRTFWLVVAQPEGCPGIRLRTWVEGIVQTKWGPFAIYPQERVWANRPYIDIQ